MKKVLILGVMLGMWLAAAPALAQPDDAAESATSWVFPSGNPVAWLGASIGAGLIAMGAGRGI